MDILSLLQGQSNGNPLAALQGLLLNQSQQQNMGASFGGNVPVPSPQPSPYAMNQINNMGGLPPILQQIDAQEPSYNSYGPGHNQFQDGNANMGGPQLPVQAPVQSSANTATLIKQQLGAIEPQKPNTVNGILSGRFGGADLSGIAGTGYGDYAQGVVQSALGKPTLGTQIGQERSNGVLSTLARLQELDNQNRKLDYMTTSGSQLPAPVQIANEIAKARAAGDTQRVNDLSLAAKIYDKGVIADAGGNASSIPGYNNAVGGKKFAEDRGGAAGKASIENDKTNMSLDTLGTSIQEARQLLPKVSLTGPILGRVGEAENDPDYKNLQGSLNSITLQAKDLYNLGSGQGFSDNDLKFLSDVVAGKYSRADTISKALDRMENIRDKRKGFLANQNQSFGNEFNYSNQPSPTSATQPSGKVLTYNPQTGKLE